jgi:hypothetical protein
MQILKSISFAVNATKFLVEGGGYIQHYTSQNMSLLEHKLRLFQQMISILRLKTVIFNVSLRYIASKITYLSGDNRFMGTIDYISLWGQ